LDNWEERTFEISDVFGEFLSLVESHWLMLVLVALVPGLLYTWADLNADMGAAAALGSLLSFVILYLQIFVIVRLARDRGLLNGRDHEDGSPTLGMYFRVFGQSIVWSLAVFVGLVILILPGVWLLTMWYAVLPVLLVENEDVMDTFGRSKALVTPHFWKVLILVLITASFYVAPVMGLFFLVPAPDGSLLWSSLLLNLALQFGQTGAWVLSLATYIRLANQSGQEGVGDIFA